MANTEDRHRGGQVFEQATIKNLALTDTLAGVSTGINITAFASEINKLNLSPLGDPTFAAVTVDTGGDCNIYDVPITLNVATANDSANTTQRASVWYHIEDTAGLLLAGSAAFLSGSSGGRNGAVNVFPSSTANYSHGRIVATSTGGATMRITSTGDSTGRLFITLANGLVVAGSTIIFT